MPAQLQLSATNEKFLIQIKLEKTSLTLKGFLRERNQLKYYLLSLFTYNYQNRIPPVDSRKLIKIFK